MKVKIETICNPVLMNFMNTRVYVNVVPDMYKESWHVFFVTDHLENLPCHSAIGKESLMERDWKRFREYLEKFAKEQLPDIERVVHDRTTYSVIAPMSPNTIMNLTDNKPTQAVLGEVFFTYNTGERFRKSYEFPPVQMNDVMY